MTAIPQQNFDENQTNYLQGFVTGADTARSLRGVPTLTNLTVGATTGKPKLLGPESIHLEAQNRITDSGKQLTNEEKAKQEKNPLDIWDQMAEQANAAQFPKGTDVFLYKFHGLFFVAPAQDSYMCRLRFPAGIVSSHQLRGVADLAQNYGGGYTHVTTRANLQIREINASNGLKVLTGLQDLGILNRGAGADNIRNITASPTAGIDSQELIDTRPLARQLHYHILNHRELYGLPRKFNIAFDGGGRISSVADTNDIGFMAVRLNNEHATTDFPAGVYFRMELGGITGHGDFSRDTSVMLKPDQCIAAATAVLMTFIRHGDRTDRKKARMKYLLDAWGFDRFMTESQKDLPFTWPKFDLAHCESRGTVDLQAHVGIHPQNQPGKSYVGIALPVGKLTVDQMHALAAIADRYGSGTIRLTVWQNLLISDIDDSDLDAVKQAIESSGLDWRANSFRAGLIACTGNTGCKFSASDTKRHADQIATHLESRLQLDVPINIHLTGCPHSCAQHYIGDIGLLGTSISKDDDMIEGYHIYVGGGYGDQQKIGREIYKNIPAGDAPTVLERMVRAYLAHRQPNEPFSRFTNRHDIDQLHQLFDIHQLTS